MQNKVQQQDSDELSIRSVMMTRKKVVDMYLNSRHYSDIISDEDQIQLKRYEKSQIALKIGEVLFFGGCIGLRYYATSSKYSHLYGKNIVIQSLSKIPFFFAHGFNAWMLVFLDHYYDKIVLEKSLKLIEKYDPEASHIFKFNQILV